MPGVNIFICAVLFNGYHIPSRQLLSEERQESEGVLCTPQAPSSGYVSQKFQAERMASA